MRAATEGHFDTRNRARPPGQMAKAARDVQKSSEEKAVRPSPPHADAQ